MTTREKLEAKLTERGMSEQQACQVLNLAIPEIEAQTPQYQITWNGRYEDYPEVMYSIWFRILKPIALKWLETNKPLAWFLPMFKD